MELHITWIGGNCPVQGEGTVDGVPFYFRARGEYWSFTISLTKCGELGFYRRERWGDGPYDAGWMPERVAREIIERCAMEYGNRIILIDDTSC